MTVIFQLFCVDDLRRLLSEAGAHERLLAIIRAHIPAQQLILKATNDTKVDKPEETPDQILAAIQKRFDAVSEQLQSPLPKGPDDPPRPEQEQQLLDLLVDARNRRVPPMPDQEDTIRRWAISCEVNHYNFYYPLLKIKEEAYALFKEKTGQLPKGPDSYYAVFNPLNPLYELFAELELKRPNA